MNKNALLLSTDKIKNRIYTLRNLQVMLDSDLAILYNVLTKNLNKAVKRNIDRFPEQFMFQLNNQEFEDLKFQFGTSSWGGTRKLPFAFTEQGVAMLSGVLKSETAVKVSIQIMDAFVSMRKFINSNALIFQRLDKVEIKQLEHDRKFNEIFDAIQSKDIKPEKGIFFDGQIFDAYPKVAVQSLSEDNVSNKASKIEYTKEAVTDLADYNIYSYIYAPSNASVLIEDVKTVNLENPNIKINNTKEFGIENLNSVLEGIDSNLLCISGNELSTRVFVNEPH